ncbi:MAG TPA: hypothetical protein VNK41_04750 [Vicinamibacterales bacterium]|nr:hypothetical protein [Vicinamibacterales bacterium]
MTRRLRLTVAGPLGAASPGFGRGSGADVSSSPPVERAATVPIAARALAPRSGPGAWLVETGCRCCHAASVYGARAAVPFGPGLSVAVEGVTARCGISLDEFFASRRGAVALVLGSQINLTPAQRKEAVAR